MPASPEYSTEFVPSAVHRRGFVPSGDVRIHYRRFGEGQGTPLIIAHGLSFFSYDWIGVADKLAADRQIVAMDMRGFGESSWSPENKYDVADFANDLITLMDHFEWPKAILFGHSMGGRGCVVCAADNPDRVTALVLGDYTPEANKAATRRVRELVGGAPDVFATIEEAMQWFGADQSKPKAVARFHAFMQPAKGGYVVKRDPYFRENFRRILNGEPPAAAGPDIWQALGRVACPILEIRGARSPLFDEEAVERVKSANPHLTLVEVDAGHNIGTEQPEAVVAEISRFLEEHAL